MQKISPCLWFDNEAEEAAKFYVSIFKNSKLGKIMYYDKASSEASGMPAGSVLTVEFELEGQQFTALNGGPYFKFSGAVSFMISCKTQEEVDYFWEKLSEDGEAGQCGWINKDKFGLTWQVVPTILDEYIKDPDPVKAQRVMEAMLKMNKIIIEDLKKAYDAQ